jgi:hypothetical protein
LPSTLSFQRAPSAGQLISHHQRENTPWLYNGSVN